MRYSTSIFALAAPLLVSAAPARITQRAAADLLVFQFADVLEQLETQFYTQALAQFQESDFISAGFTSAQIPIQQFTSIQSDESTHASFIETSLQSLGVSTLVSSSCTFDFSSVLTDVATMAATARVVENVGVAAYLGGATLITDPVFLDAAASILTVEARHQTILNVLSGGTAIPSAFDIPLTPSEVLAIAGAFISGCDVGIPANPSLSITNTGTVAPGTQLTFSSAAINSSVDTSGFFCQMMIGGLPNSISLPFDSCIVPSGINGPVAIWITSDDQPLINNVRDRATSQLVAGPTMAFIDTVPELLEMMVRAGSSSSGSSSGSSTESSDQSVTTQTISPADASSIIASASATATDSSNASAATASPVDSASSASSSQLSSGPSDFTGVSADGKVTVNGWSTVSSNSTTSA